jgi:hypothetical protein
MGQAKNRQRTLAFVVNKESNDRHEELKLPHEELKLPLQP